MSQLAFVDGAKPTTACPLRERCLQAMSRIDTLSDRKWHFFRREMNPFDFDFDKSVNRAFYKLWEILSAHPELIQRPDPRSLHLAEAPGSFVQVMKKRFPRGSCVAVTRPVTGPGIPDFSPRVRALPGTHLMYADLSSRQSAARFICSQRDRYDFITADGGVDEKLQYQSKETLHVNLILAQIVHILCLQARGGCCVVKIFETTSETTIHVLYLLARYYHKCAIIKPCTSRPTNSERYFMCMGFTALKDDTRALINLITKEPLDGKILFSNVPPDFSEYVQRHSDELTARQADHINQVIAHIEELDSRHAILNKRHAREMKRRAYREWCAYFGYDGSTDP